MVASRRRGSTIVAGTVSRLRRHQRIRPARARRSGRRTLALVLGGLVVGAMVATTVASRSDRRSLALEGAPAYRLTSGAGPVEVVAGPSARLDYRASWLVAGPELVEGAPAVVADDGGSGPSLLPAIDLAIDCPSRWPCLVSSRLQLPPGAGLEAHATDGPVVIGSMAGPVVVSTAGDDDVLLGPVAGPVSARTERGAVIGTDLTGPAIEVTTGSGPVELRFRARPRTVVVEAGDAPVTIELPPGRYAVTVEGTRTATIDVDRDDRADSRISVDGLGPVRIIATTDPTADPTP